MRKFHALAAALAAALAPSIATAQPVAILAGAVDSGDTAWMLVAAALVMLMAAPGMMLFQAGRLRAGNVLSTMLQAGAAMAAVSLLWVVAGHTIAFGDSASGWIGSGNLWMLIGTGDLLHGDSSITERTFALFQMASAAIAAVVMTGAWAGRGRLGWSVAFAGLWSLAVYAPIAHWIWGDGWLATTMGTLDQSGGLVVHAAAGVSALVAGLLVGKRRGFPGRPQAPHSAPLALAGAALLWVGSFGFSGGAALSATDAAAGAIINTHLAACAAALVWLLAERIRRGKPTSLGFATGAVAGLATISSVAGFVSPGAAILVGVIGALASFAMTGLLRNRLEIDDTLDVFAVHATGGITGALRLAAFLSPATGGIGYADGVGAGSQIAAQLVGAFAVTVWAALGSTLIALLVNLALPMRVGEEDEDAGLDQAIHGERAWHLD